MGIDDDEFQLSRMDYVRWFAFSDWMEASEFLSRDWALTSFVCHT